MCQNWASIRILVFETDFNHTPVLGIPLKRTLNLEDEARPAELKSCHPWGECKFTLQMRKGGLVRIHDSILMAESKYKCLLISEHTTGELHSYCNILLSYLLCHTDTMQFFSKKHKICEYVQGRGTSVLGEVRNV